MSDAFELPEWTKHDDLGGRVPSDVREAIQAAFLAGRASAAAEFVAFVGPDGGAPLTRVEKYWYEQGRLAERDPRTSAEAALREALLQPVKGGLMDCEDCDGSGVVGDEVHQGEFQPPERDRCPSCNGSGHWQTDLFTRQQINDALAHLVLVPRTATAPMLQAGAEADTQGRLEEIYAAMIAAAPSVQPPPSPAPVAEPAVPPAMPWDAVMFAGGDEPYSGNEINRAMAFAQLTELQQSGVRIALAESALNRPASPPEPPARLPVAYLRSITHPDWLEVCQRDSEGAFAVFAEPREAALREARDAILHERGPIEGMGLNGDQINAVLAVLDNALASPATSPAPEGWVMVPRTATAPLLSTAMSEPVETIDLDLDFWESIKRAAGESKWIPHDHYFMNDWVADVCRFLREPPPEPAVPEPALLLGGKSPGQFLWDAIYVCEGGDWRGVEQRWRDSIWEPHGQRVLAAFIAAMSSLKAKGDSHD